MQVFQMVTTFSESDRQFYQEEKKRERIAQQVADFVGGAWRALITLDPDKPFHGDRYYYSCCFLHFYGLSGITYSVLSAVTRYYVYYAVSNCSRNGKKDEYSYE